MKIPRLRRARKWYTRMEVPFIRRKPPYSLDELERYEKLAREIHDKEARGVTDEIVHFMLSANADWLEKQ